MERAQSLDRPHPVSSVLTEDEGLVAVEHTLTPELKDYVTALAEGYPFNKDMKVDQRRVIAELAGFWPDLPEWSAQAFELWSAINDVVQALPPHASSPDVLLRISVAKSELTPSALPEPDESAVIATFDANAGIFRRRTISAQVPIPVLDDMKVPAGLMVVCQPIPPVVSQFHDNQPYIHEARASLYSERVRDVLVKGGDPVDPPFIADDPVAEKETLEVRKRRLRLFEDDVERSRLAEVAALAALALEENRRAATRNQVEASQQPIQTTAEQERRQNDHERRSSPHERRMPGRLAYMRDEDVLTAGLTPAERESIALLARQAAATENEITAVNAAPVELAAALQRPGERAVSGALETAVISSTSTLSGQQATAAGAIGSYPGDRRQQLRRSAGMSDLNEAGGVSLAPLAVSGVLAGQGVLPIVPVEVPALAGGLANNQRNALPPRVQGDEFLATRIPVGEMVGAPLRETPLPERQVVGATGANISRDTSPTSTNGINETRGESLDGRMHENASFRSETAMDRGSVGASNQGVEQEKNGRVYNNETPNPSSYDQSQEDGHVWDSLHHAEDQSEKGAGYWGGGLNDGPAQAFDPTHEMAGGAMSRAFEGLRAVSYHVVDATWAGLAALSPAARRAYLRHLEQRQQNYTPTPAEREFMKRQLEEAKMRQEADQEEAENRAERPEEDAAAQSSPLKPNVPTLDE